MPIFCTNYHRLCYFMRSTKGLKPLRLVILPYLHERKLFVMRSLESSVYFSTVMSDYSD